MRFLFLFVALSAPIDLDAFQERVYRLQNTAMWDMLRPLVNAMEQSESPNDVALYMTEVFGDQMEEYEQFLDRQYIFNPMKRTYEDKYTSQRTKSWISRWAYGEGWELVKDEKTGHTVERMVMLSA